MHFKIKMSTQSACWLLRSPCFILFYTCRHLRKKKNYPCTRGNVNFWKSETYIAQHQTVVTNNKNLYELMDIFFFYLYSKAQTVNSHVHFINFFNLIFFNETNKVTFFILPTNIFFFFFLEEGREGGFNVTCSTIVSATIPVL